MIPPPPELDPARRRPWRVAFVLYALAMTAGTHWPAFTLGPEVPATDKTIHLVAYAGLTWLLGMTGWVRGPWRCAGIAFAWSIVDELTQGIPAVGRQVGWPDLVANFLGCASAGAWIAAWRPVGGPGGRWRQALIDAAFCDVFRRPRAWFAFGALAVAFAGTWIGLNRVDVPAMLGSGWPRSVNEQWMFAAAVLVIGHVGVLLLMRWWNANIGTMVERRACVRCGAAVPDSGTGAAIVDCPACGACAWSGAWRQAAPLRLEAMVRALRVPGTVVAGTLVLALGVLATAPYVLARRASGKDHHGWEARALDVLRDLPDLQRPIDLALVLLVCAAGARWYRVRAAAWYDDAPECRRCGHDLQATPVGADAEFEPGLGRCGECGAWFVRTGEEAESA